VSYKFAHVHKSYDTDQKEGKRIHFVQKFQRKANLIMYVYNLENLSFKRTELASQTLIRETVPVRPWPSVPAISLLLWKDWKQPTSLAVAHISGRRTKGCYTLHVLHSAHDLKLGKITTLGATEKDTITRVVFYGKKKGTPKLHSRWNS
jgi:hypothetical protein